MHKTIVRSVATNGCDSLLISSKKRGFGEFSKGKLLGEYIEGKYENGRWRTGTDKEIKRLTGKEERSPINQNEKVNLAWVMWKEWKAVICQNR